MKKTKDSKLFFIAGGLLLLFLLFTAAVCIVDVQSIGPNNSEVGFATVNGAYHNFIGTNMTLYTITDWLGFVPLLTVFGFAVLGLVQLIQRKSLMKVDFDILILGNFYIVTLAAYLLFEVVAVNYRPVLIEGVLEASYPSSTTLLTLCVMPTAVMQFCRRVKKPVARNIINCVIIAFTAFMVIGRLVSGVHWLTDIIGGMILAGGLVTMYAAVTGLKKEN